MFVNIITGIILIFTFAIIFAQAILLKEKSDRRSRREKEWSERNLKGKD